MKTRLIAAAVLSLISLGAMAQNAPAGSVQRDVNQQNRIEQGLQSGSLNTREAAALEKEQAHVEKMQANTMRDGKVTPAEQARLDKAQDKASRDIATAKHNGVNGDPLSASSQRMQADVQRNANQQQRIENGIKDGSLTSREAARLERGQSRVDRKQAVAGSDGHVGAAEQARLQHAENRQSHRIHNQRHDAQVR